MPMKEQISYERKPYMSRAKENTFFTLSIENTPTRGGIEERYGGTKYAQMHFVEEYISRLVSNGGNR